MKKKHIILCLALLAILAVTPMYADLNVSVTGDIPGQLGVTYLNDFISQFNDVWNSGASLTADSFAIANYSTSTTGIAKFDGFIIGAMFSPTFATTAEAIKSGMKDGLGAAKGGAFNAGILFGFSLSNSIDLLFHGVYLPAGKYIKSMDKFSIFGGGVKLRINLIGPLKAAGTGLDGLTLSFSGGYSRAIVSYSLALNSRANYTVGGILNGTLTFDGFGGEAKINSFYAAVDLKIYFRILSFLGLYGGAGLIWDKATINVSALGTATNTVDTLGTQTGTIRISGDTTSSHFIPNIMVGVCFNIAFIKIPIQLSMTFSPKTESTPIWNLTGGVLFNF